MNKKSASARDIVVVGGSAGSHPDRVAMLDEIPRLLVRGPAPADASELEMSARQLARLIDQEIGWGSAPK